MLPHSEHLVSRTELKTSSLPLYSQQSQDTRASNAMNTEENPLFDLVLALGLALAVVLIVMQKNSGITLFAQWGVPIELTVIIFSTFFRGWVLMTHRHLYRGLRKLGGIQEEQGAE
jgi:hydrogenase-4 membrane subunit HyfE